MARTAAKLRGADGPVREQPSALSAPGGRSGAPVGHLDLARSGGLRVAALGAGPHALYQHVHPDLPVAHIHPRFGGGGLPAPAGSATSGLSRCESAGSGGIAAAAPALRWAPDR